MLRTIVVRNQLLNETLRKAVRSNITRCVTTELSRRKLSCKLLQTPQIRVPKTPWSIQSRCYSSLPTHYKVNLPALSPTMENGSIVSWEKKEGDKLSEGDLLCEIETDKATMGFETPEEGYLAKILIPAGTKGVPVGKLLCIIVEEQKDVAAFKDFKDDSPAPPPKPAKKEKKAAEAPSPAPAAQPAAPAAAPAPPAPAPARASAPAPARASATAAPAPDKGSRLYASPFAKRIAELKNLRLGGKGSGLYGSLKAGDLSGEPATVREEDDEEDEAPAAHGPTSAFVDIPLTSMREIIAKRMMESKQTVPHFGISVTVNMEKTLAFRNITNERLAAAKSDVKLSINDFVVKAVASAAKRVPAVNAYWLDTFIRQFSNVDVSVAVATPKGLLTPILFNADSRGMLELSRNMKILATKAKTGRLAPHEYQGGTIAVSNLGMYGITHLNAIINPPQSMIIAAGGIQEQVIPDKDAPNGFRTAPFVTFTASGDHRVIDGKIAAEFMMALKENLQNPANMIL